MTFRETNMADKDYELLYQLFIKHNLPSIVYKFAREGKIAGWHFFIRRIEILLSDDRLVVQQ